MSKEGEIEFYYPKVEVFDALIKVIPTIRGMKVVKIDEINNRILVKAGISLTSWGENIPIYLTEISPGITRVHVNSEPEFDPIWKGALDFGKNKRNIEQIFNALSLILNENPAITVQSPYLHNLGKLCPNCGFNNTEDSNFCEECGTKL